MFVRVVQNVYVAVDITRLQHNLNGAWVYLRVVVNSTLVVAASGVGGYSDGGFFRFMTLRGATGVLPIGP